MKTGMKNLLWKLGITTRTDYELLLRVVSGQRVAHRELQRCFDFRKIADTLAHADICGRVNRLEAMVQRVAIKIALNDIEGMGEKE